MVYEGQLVQANHVNSRDVSARCRTDRRQLELPVGKNNRYRSRITASLAPARAAALVRWLQALIIGMGAVVPISWRALRSAPGFLRADRAHPETLLVVGCAVASPDAHAITGSPVRTPQSGKVSDGSPTATSSIELYRAKRCEAFTQRRT